ncbi:alpha/beta hydrolase [Thalassotalea ganghwensis]
MKRLLWLHYLVLFFVTFGVCAQQYIDPNEITTPKEPDNLVRFKTQDELMLAGYYFSGLEQRPGVLILHDCSNSAESYTMLAKAIAETGLNALALDLRGYGYSSNVIYSHSIIKKTSKDLNMYQSEVVRITSFWESDIAAAYHYLQNKIGKEQPISVVSSGCTAPQAVYLAEKIRVHSFVMITPKFSFMDREKYKNLIDIPVYFLSSAHHAESNQVAQELFEWNGDGLSSLQIVKGNREGHIVLNRNPYLLSNIATWLNRVMEK